MLVFIFLKFSVDKDDIYSNDLAFRGAHPRPLSGGQAGRYIVDGEDLFYYLQSFRV